MCSSRSTAAPSVISATAVHASGEACVCPPCSCAGQPATLACVASENGDQDDDATEGSHGPRECMPCRGTGRVISNLGGAQSTSRARGAGQRRACAGDRRQAAKLERGGRRRRGLRARGPCVQRFMQVLRSRRGRSMQALTIASVETPRHDIHLGALAKPAALASRPERVCPWGAHRRVAMESRGWCKYGS